MGVMRNIGFQLHSTRGKGRTDQGGGGKGGERWREGEKMKEE